MKFVSEEPLDSEISLEAQLIDQIDKANALQFTINTEGWDLITGSFESIEEDALEQLGQQRPGDDKSILAAFSVWYSVRSAYKNVREAVISAIRAGEAAKVALAELKNAPDEENWS